MADIIDLQAREQEVIKEVAKPRNLQEIQEEQAFQEWWNLESRRAQEEENARSRVGGGGNRVGGKERRDLNGTSSAGRGNKGGRGRGRGRGGDRGRGRGGGGEASAAR
jgi:hypothetical protein